MVLYFKSVIRSLERLCWMKLGLENTPRGGSGEILRRHWTKCCEITTLGRFYGYNGYPVWQSVWGGSTRASAPAITSIALGLVVLRGFDG